MHVKCFIMRCEYLAVFLLIIALIAVSGCTQNSNKINITIDSMEYHWGNALNPDSHDESQYFHYFTINLKNNGERIITERENSLRICGKSLALDQSFYSCGSDYALIRIKSIQIGGYPDQWGWVASINKNEVIDYYVRIEIPDYRQQQIKNAICGKTFEINVVGKDFSSGSKYDFPRERLLDSKSIVIAC